MHAATKRRLAKLQPENEELIEICGITASRAAWREMFNKIRATPLTIPLKFDLSIAAQSKFDADE